MLSCLNTYPIRDVRNPLLPETVFTFVSGKMSRVCFKLIYMVLYESVKDNRVIV